MTSPFRTDLPEPNRPTLMARHHAVVANHPWASQAAFQVLEAGGNAVDAGVAGGLALNVIESDMCHFLGVAPTMLYMAGSGEVVSAVGPGPWPEAATLDYFWEKHGGIVPRGILHSVVPSAPDTWITLLERYGTMSFGEVAGAAIRFARDGFPMFFLRRDRTIEMFESGLHYACPTTDAVFAPSGRVPPIGEIFRQPAQASMLQYIVDQETAAAKHGRVAGLKAARDAVYKGDVARALIRLQEELGGLMTMADLSSYEGELEKPIRGRFGDWDMYVSGPWGQGPMVLEALNLTMVGVQMDFGRAMPPTDPDERALMAALSREPRHIDEVVRASGLAAATVSGTLAMLELKGLVRDLGGMQYVRVREGLLAYDAEAGTAAPEHAE